MNVFYKVIIMLSIISFDFLSVSTQANNRMINLDIKKSDNDSEVLLFKLTNLSQEILQTTDVGLNNNIIIIENSIGKRTEEQTYINSSQVEIYPNKSKVWEVNIENILSSNNYIGFQRPDNYTIFWKITYWNNHKKKKEIVSAPFTYAKKINSDFIFKIRNERKTKDILMFYIMNKGDLDTVMISNQYDMIITDNKGCSITYYPSKKQKDVSLLPRRFHAYEFKMNKILKEYKSTGLQQAGEYTIQWKLDCSDTEDYEYEAISPEFTYIKD